MPDYIVRVRNYEILEKVIEASNADEAKALAGLEEWTPENGWDSSYDEYGHSYSDTSVVSVENSNDPDDALGALSTSSFYRCDLVNDPYWR